MILLRPNRLTFACGWPVTLAALGLVLIFLSACSAGKYRQKADTTAAAIIDEKQKEALGHTEDFYVEPPSETFRRRIFEIQGLPYSHPGSLNTKNLKPIEHWPKDDYLEENTNAFYTIDLVDVPTNQPVLINLTNALKIAAMNSRDYQSSKEDVFDAALQLDLNRDAFRSTFTALIDSQISTDRAPDDPITQIQSTPSLSLDQQLKTGASITANIGINLVKLLSPKDSSSRALFSDATVFIPLLRGSGRHIVAEPLTQAERNVIYQIWNFERSKRTFAVRIAREYFEVLQTFDALQNAEQNYKGAIASARRSRRLGDAGRLTPVQVDQAIQDEYRAREGWIRAQENLQRRLDSFKLSIGLPTDAQIQLDQDDLSRLTASTRESIPIGDGAISEVDTAVQIPPADAPIELQQPTQENAGPYELNEDFAIQLALTNRLDLRIAQGNVYDAQRNVVVRADGLRAELNLLGRGESGGDSLEFDRGTYSALLTLDLPIERTSEMITYRRSYLDLEQTVRSLQQLEDSVKLDIRNNLRNLRESRENLQIQALARDLAERRVASTQLFLEAGRAEIRDLLDARDALLSAQDSLTSALINYRLAELELQRDLGVLEVSPEGLWEEYNPPPEATAATTTLSAN